MTKHQGWLETALTIRTIYGDVHRIVIRQPAAAPEQEAAPPPQETEAERAWRATREIGESR